MTVSRYDLRTTDGLSGHVFDASDLFTAAHGLLMDVSLTFGSFTGNGFNGAVVNLSDFPVKNRRIHETIVTGGRTWTVQVWASTAVTRSYQTTTSHGVSLTTTTLVISDGSTPLAVAFTTADGHTGHMNKANLGVGFPGLRSWLGKSGPGRNPPWEPLRLIHQVLMTGTGNGVLSQSLKAASLGISDPELAFRVWASGANLSEVPAPPVGVDQKVWTVRWVAWYDYLHALFASWITLDEISHPRDTVNELWRPSIATTTRTEWARFSNSPVDLAASWAAVEPDPQTVSGHWIFDRANLTVAYAYPPEFALEARAAGWTPAQTGTFFRFHIDLCQGCDSRHGVDRWSYFKPSEHALKEGVLASTWAPGVLGWAPLMPAELAATHMAAGITVAEATLAPMSLETARVAAALHAVRVPVFATPAA